MLLEQSAAVAVIATIISESYLLTPIRKLFESYYVNCPICMGIALAAPTLYYGVGHYFLVVALSNAWMLVILKLYNELERGE